MFIRSRNENTNKNDAIQIHTNYPVKISNINKVELFINRPYHKIDFGNGVEWAYVEKEDALSEYDWIMDQVGAVQNVSEAVVDTEHDTTSETIIQNDNPEFNKSGGGGDYEDQAQRIARLAGKTKGKNIVIMVKTIQNVYLFAHNADRACSIGQRAIDLSLREYKKTLSFRVEK